MFTKAKRTLIRLGLEKVGSLFFHPDIHAVPLLQLSFFFAFPFQDSILDNKKEFSLIKKESIAYTSKLMKLQLYI
jgi:hypothetical protein